MFLRSTFARVWAAAELAGRPIIENRSSFGSADDSPVIASSHHPTLRPLIQATVSRYTSEALALARGRMKIELSNIPLEAYQLGTMRKKMSAHKADVFSCVVLKVSRLE